MTQKLIHGECLAEMAKLPDASVDMVMCDLPYGFVNRKSGGLRNLDKGKADVCGIDLNVLMSEYKRLCTGTVYVFCGTEQVSVLREGLNKRGFTTRLGIWEKTNPSPMNGQYLWLSNVECCVFGRLKGSIFTEHCASSVWRNACGRGNVHPTQKPLSLMERLIKASSAEDMTVLDNCMGSGTTGVACVNLNRNFIGIEQDEGYFEIAKKRIGEAENKASSLALDFWEET